jgi:hypothetical protein
VQEDIYNIGVLTVNIEFMWRGLETGKRTSFSESFHLFRAESHKFYIYRKYTNIVFILQYNLQKTVIQFNNKIKRYRNPIDTSIVVPVRGVA